METPALNKMKRAKEDGSQIIGEFIEWLHSEGLCVAKPARPPYDAYWWPDARPIEKLLADYYGIDLMAVEREREAMLAELRASHEAAE
ncbi:MAG: hypothetical protein AAGA95_22075 [Pseudomonadota bacterium]